MKKKLFYLFLAASTAAFFVSSCVKNLPGLNDCSQDDLVATVSTYASGLNNPRGLAFGPDGDLYVAEGGVGGTDSTVGLCDQLGYRGSSDGARIVKINRHHEVVTVAEDLPSSQASDDEGDVVSGVSGVAFIGKTLYGLLAGAGCTHGVASTPNGIVKVHADKTWEIVADLSAYLRANPVQNPPADFEPDGTWYALTEAGGNLYALESNHGELVKITPSGSASRVADFTINQGHIVPTAIKFHNGNFYVGNLDVFPIAGQSKIYKVTPSGEISEVASGFSAILGIAFDRAGGMYVLENTTGNPFPTPGTGDVIRIDPSGARRTIVTGLNLPTAMIFGPDNNLYISNWGFGPPAIGGGEILKVDLSCPKDQVAKKS